MYVAIAGNIGSGKTTLTSMLAEHFAWTPLYEPLEDNPYIADFYSDMRRWAFNLQIYFLYKRFSRVIDFHKQNENIIQDRTLFEDAQVFAPNLLSMGLLSLKDYETYISLFNLMVSLTPSPDLLIYLKASVPTLVNQINQRGRMYESSIRLDYITSLNKRYDEWIEKYEGKKLIINVDDLNIVDKPEDLGVVTDKINAEINGLFK
ncbi:MAG: deoxynucleoside kinase [Bacteroidales bacterium]|nr:deoxynucleoside kinase [Bacteroidales bacterium]